MNTSDDRCGTYAGYQAHIRAKEATCAACRRASADYINERRKNADLRKREIEQEQARRRALWRLARMHPTMFRALYAEESADIPDVPRKSRQKAGVA